MQRIEMNTFYGEPRRAIRYLAEAGDERSITLDSDHPVAIGEWVGFSVALADGRPFFEGRGLCRGHRRGRERADEPYRIVLEDLALEGRNAEVYRQVLAERQTLPPPPSKARHADSPTVRAPRPSRAAPPSWLSEIDIEVELAESEIEERPTAPPPGPSSGSYAFAEDELSALSELDSSEVAGDSQRSTVPGEPVELVLEIESSQVIRAQALKADPGDRDPEGTRRFTSTAEVLRQALALGLAALESQQRHESPRGA